MNSDEYTELLVNNVSKKGILYSCGRCGALVLYKSVHDAWHVTNDRYEQAFFDILLTLISEGAEKTDHIMERTTRKEE